MYIIKDSYNGCILIYELWGLFYLQCIQRYFCTLQVVKLAKEKAKEFEFDVERKKIFR